MVYNGTNVDYTEPKQLAALSYHSGTIHTVRFSNSNKYLASGADDKIVCIYYLDPTPPTHTTFGSNEQPPVENWRIFRRLIGHENDVQDLGWSCDASILVSVGLDSRVVVWSGHTFEKLKTLSNHGSHVKGITFDPANKYFATASDDRTIKIFRYTPPAPNSTAYDQTNNFMIEATISSPFITSPLTTYFRRCSWSPDGNHIAAANAVNGPISTAAVINRGTWDSDISLIGHEAPVEVCSFSPRIFSNTPDEQLDPNEVKGSKGVTVIACAGQDRSLSIWNTVNSKPLVVNEGVCLKSISDLAWAPDGERLFITGLDGTIALVKFGQGELGYPVPLEYNESSLAKYGAGRKVGVVEGPDGLLLEERSKSDELRNVQGRMGELMGDGGSSKPNGAGKMSTINGSVHDGGKNQDMDVSKLTNGHAPGADVSRAQTPQPVGEDANATRVERLKQRVTITKDGRKRVAPLLVSSAAGTTESSLPTSQLMSHSSQVQRNDAPQNVLDLSKPYDGLPKGGLASLLLGGKRKLAETGSEDDNSIRQRNEAAERQGATSLMMDTAEGLTTATSTFAQSHFTTPQSVLNPSLMLSRIRLATPLIRTHIVRPLGNGVRQSEPLESDQPGANGGQNHVFEVRNPSGATRTGRAGDRDPARITVTKRGQMLWQDFLPKPVVLVTGNERFWAASCDDGSVFVWTPAGRRLFNAFVLEAQVVILDCRGPWLLAVSAVGLCHVWDIASSSSPHPPISLAPVLDVAALSQGPHLTVGPSIIFARLNSEGRVIVAMSNGDAFTYSQAMYTWQRVSEAWWAVGSQYWNSSESAKTIQSTNKATDDEHDDEVRIENISAGVISLLERNTTSYTLLRGRAYFLQRLIKALLSAEGYEGLESGISVAHLENRLAAALTLGAKDEFKIYLGMYAKRLGAEGSRLKIEELLRSLLAGVYTENDTSTLTDSSRAYMGGPSDELCGWKKHALLKEVVLILGKYRDLQRTTLPYARLLGITSIEKDDAEMES
ncbi:MAG: HIR complex subunit [Chrysothrix sp. TS-e1954]|nr:MAG: HIR complex subunit [Chrysothrix sp. TS-e1954]